MGYTIRTEKDIEELLSEHTRLIVKEIKAVTTEEEQEPGREFEIYLIEPTLPQDFKGFVQRLAMLINEMDASEIIYNTENNSMRFWYDH